MSVYKWINILSLDIVVGALCSCIFFSRVFGVEVLLPEYGVLGITVWILYTLDHLLDAYRIKDKASTQRHHFHQTNFKILSIAVVIGGCLVIILLQMVRSELLYRGAILILLAVLYLVGHRKLRLIKEWLGALLYTAGVALPTFPGRQLSPPEIFAVVAFLLTAYNNLLIFSWFDEDSDRLDKQPSITTSLGADLVLLLTKGLVSLASIGTGFMFIYYHAYSFLLLTAMNLVLLLIVLLPSYFKQDSRYRMLGDAVFFLPSIALFL